MDDESLKDLINNEVGIRNIKTAIRTSINPQDLLDTLIYIIRSDIKLYYDKLFAIILEDDFVNWILIQLQRNIGRSEENFIEFLVFIVASTDRSNAICERVCSIHEFKTIIKNIIANHSDNLTINFELLCIINNISFNYEVTFFQDTVIKEFLFKYTRMSKELGCIVTLIRLSSQEEIDQFDDIICKFIPDLISCLEQCCLSDRFHYEYYNLGEILKYIDTMCRCKAAKRELSQNFTLLFKLRLILRNDRFLSFAIQTKDLLHAVYCQDQVLQIIKEIEDFS